MRKILPILVGILINSIYLFSNGPPDKPTPQPPVVTPYIPRELPIIRHNPAHR